MNIPAQIATSMRRLAEIRSYGELLSALRARADELKVTRMGLDDITGLQNGYAAKLLAPVPIKSLGKFSMGPMLSAMGCMLILVEDADTLARITKRVAKRQNPNQPDDANRKMQTTKRSKRNRFPRSSEFGKIMRARGVLALSPRQRKEIAKAAAKARWRNHIKGEKRGSKRRKSITAKGLQGHGGSQEACCSSNGYVISSGANSDRKPRGQGEVG